MRQEVVFTVDTPCICTPYLTASKSSINEENMIGRPWYPRKHLYAWCKGEPKGREGVADFFHHLNECTYAH